mmetsp:Transcript_69639/g.163815  ORF Transcript_69639/g.163815 Transcript_69639/m.163815 type:complete len:114 (+) Transcript_69639:1019-1360(+)
MVKERAPLTGPLQYVTSLTVWDVENATTDVAARAAGRDTTTSAGATEMGRATRSAVTLTHNVLSAAVRANAVTGEWRCQSIPNTVTEFVLVGASLAAVVVHAPDSNEKVRVAE